MKLFKDFPYVPKIMVTGGAGFIGGAVIRNLLKNSESIVFNIDKIGYASDTTSIEKTIKTQKKDISHRYKLLKVDISNKSDILSAVETSDPDLVLHLAAESHVDRSINGPKAFIESNILGTFNLLEALRKHYSNMNSARKNSFRLLHVSTDEVFGTLDKKGRFDESYQYDPRSPYSASKASSDHLVNAWHHTFGIPVITTNCSNNYGPWQYPEKLIPKIIYKAINGEKIPIYGKGENIRDWLYVEDHVDGLFKVLEKGKLGQKYCIGGSEEKTNNEIANFICNYLDKVIPKNYSHKNLISYVEDRQGHDYRYAINASKIINELNWEPKTNFELGLKITIDWYLKNMDWMEI